MNIQWKTDYCLLKKDAAGVELSQEQLETIKKELAKLADFKFERMFMEVMKPAPEPTTLKNHYPSNYMGIIRGSNLA